MSALPSAVPQAPHSGVELRVERERPRCTCAHCTRPWHSAPPDPDRVEEPRRSSFERVLVGGQATTRQAGAGIFGARKSGASRYVEMRAMDRLRALGDAEDLAPGHRRALGLDLPSGERPSRADCGRPKKPKRARPLTGDEQEALTQLSVRVPGIAKPLPLLPALQHWPIRHGVHRGDWISETWHALVEPPANLAPAPDLQTRLERAIWRAEYRLRAQRGEIAVPETFLTQRRQ